MKFAKKIAAAALAASMLLNCGAISSSAAKVKYLTYKGTRTIRSSTAATLTR